jgi:hypothetical protein
MDIHRIITDHIILIGTIITGIIMHHSIMVHIIRHIIPGIITIIITGHIIIQAIIIIRNML